MKKYLLTLIAIIVLVACDKKDTDELQQAYKSEPLRDYLIGHKNQTAERYFYIEPLERERELKKGIR